MPEFGTLSWPKSDISDFGCALECKLLQIIDLKDLAGRSSHRHVVLGQVVGIHIDDRFIRDGRLDTAAMGPIARCGYADYSVVDKVFAIQRPVISDP